jgi:hypothetical protein
LSEFNFLDADLGRSRDRMWLEVLDVKIHSRLRLAVPLKTSYARGAGLSFTALKSTLAAACAFAI